MHGYFNVFSKVRISVTSINDYLKTPIGLDLLTKSLTNLGFEVDDLIDHSVFIKDIIVGKILSVEKHPNATKLSICKVDIGQGSLKQVVCGASNVAEGILVAFANIGAKIPKNDMIIKHTVIRGIESEGMLCSKDELCLEYIEQKDDGILILKKGNIGEKLELALSIKKDVYIDLSITPNRKDCYEAIGLARDLHAASICEIKDEYLNTNYHDFNIKLDLDLNKDYGISSNEIEAILKRLNCIVEKKDNCIFVKPPIYRSDLNISADIVEEVLRIRGYEKIIPKSLPITLKKTVKKNTLIQDLLVFRGFLETYSYSLVHENEAQIFSNEFLKVKNTKSQELEVLRSSIYISLLKSISYNQKRSNKNLKFFEIGKEYLKKNQEVSEISVISGSLTGELKEKNWAYKQESVSIFHAKDILCEIYDGINYSIERSNFSFYHPFKQGMLLFEGEIIAHFGEIHPKVQKLFDIENPVICFSCYKDDFKQNKLKWEKELYPTVTKDFCFIVPDDFLSYKLIDAIYKELRAKSIRIFDIFTNSLNEKSITIEVTFSDPKKTLSESEINEKYNKVVSIAKNEFNAYIKGV